jgi:Tesmin/TSO1-like CXC domain, cysteine-rich domain
MIVASNRSSQQGHHPVTIANVDRNDGNVTIVQNDRFPIPVDNVLDINPKRIFTDKDDTSTSGENRPITKFRLPPRYRHLQDDDRDDAYRSKERQNAPNMVPISTSDGQTRNQRPYETMVLPGHPTYNPQHRHDIYHRDVTVGNVPALTSWTAAASSDNTDNGQPPTWRRHFFTDTVTGGPNTGSSRRIIPMDVGNDNFTRRDKIASNAVRHEVLLAELRSNHIPHGESLPQRAVVHQQQPSARYFPLTMEMTHSRQTASSGIGSITSNLNVARMGTTSRNIAHQKNLGPALLGKSSQGTGSIRPGINGPQWFTKETCRWRHPNGRIYEQRPAGQEPFIARTGSRRTQELPIGESHALYTDLSTTTAATNMSSLLHSQVPVYGQKRILSSIEQQQQNQVPPPPPPIPTFKKVKGFDKLDLLCTATLEVGEMHDNPTGCSCPKSKCVALYCDCFKAGRRCHINRCSCMNCKNTIAESGINGARTAAIRNILARNPRAFNTAGMGNPLHKLPKGEVACNCVRSKCLKLYCTCFHHGKLCRPNICSCVGCENNNDNDEHYSNRQAAIQNVMEKNVDAFTIKPKMIGQGCACKNNKCLRKYCECYRTGLRCILNKCTCRECENQGKDN